MPPAELMSSGPDPAVFSVLPLLEIIKADVRMLCATTPPLAWTAPIITRRGHTMTQHSSHRPACRPEGGGPGARSDLGRRCSA